MALTLPETIIRSATAPCPHFQDCGGCTLQDVAYSEQLRAKKQVLQEMLQRDVVIHPSPSPYHYRHRMDYITAFGKVGLRKRGDGKSVVNLGECHLVRDRISVLLPRIQEWIEEFGIRGYNLVTNRGDLRFVTFRHAFSSDQLMVILVTSSRETAIQPLLERLQNHAESVVWAVQSRHGDDSNGEIQQIYGLESLSQEILGLQFEITPGCFFQNNLLLTDRLFDEVRNHVSGLLFDLYCGTGVIGLIAAGQAERIVGVDSVEENIRVAQRNAERNGITNASYHLDNTNHFLAFHEGPVPDTVIVDPPRSGLAPKLIRKLNRLAAPKIVYVSCNPTTFLADLEQFEGYELKQATAFDMFPQTPHVEMVTLLERS